MRRDTALDFMRAVAIVLIVFGHAQRGLVAAGALTPGEPAYAFYVLSDYAIYTFHVPVFFVFSGYLLEGRRALTAADIGWRTLRLVGLYLVWSTINAVPAALFSDLINSGGGNVWSFFNPLEPSGIMWFFVALIAAHLVYVAIRNVTALCALVILGAAMALAFGYDYCGIAYGCLWFFAGAMLRRLGSLDRLRPSCGLICLTVAAFLVSTGICMYFAVPATAAFASCAAALVCLYCLGRRVPATRTASILGRETLAIYVMHVIAVAAVRIAMLKSLGSDAYVAILATSTAAGLVLPLVALTLARRVGVSRFLLLR